MLLNPYKIEISTCVAQKKWLNYKNSAYIFLVKKYKIYASKSVFMTLCAKPVKNPIPAPATKNGTAGLLIFNIT